MAIREAPVRPEQPEVDRHFASGQVPRRLWCPICARASLEEDPHRRASEDRRDNGLAMICLDYKEWVKGRAPHLVMRERCTGRTFGSRCTHKGSEDTWLVNRIVRRL